MNLLLQRTHANELRTWGKLFADGVFLCYTLEDAVREISGQPVDVWKVKGATAVPSTSYSPSPYIVTLENSPRFGPNTLTIAGVPGFVGVRMHAGNTEEDTEGCVLLGQAINAAGIVGGTSRPAVELVKKVVTQAREIHQMVLLEISNITEVA
jgi:Family of unknown function (DUF5675)